MTAPEAKSPPGTMGIGAYLDRLDLRPEAIDTNDPESLDRLQWAHVTHVPFENLSITGHPFEPYDGEPIVLSLPDIYEKIVNGQRGGYCFELNGLFHWALEVLGFDADLVAARVIREDGRTPPANHTAILVDLDRRYLVDVGLGRKKMRRPIPIDENTPATMANGAWRVVKCERPDADYRVEHRPLDGQDWRGQYRFTATPRVLGYFEPLNEYFQTAPESPFTDRPIVMIETESGYRYCSDDTLHIVEGTETTEQAIPESEWSDTVAAMFGLRIE